MGGDYLNPEEVTIVSNLVSNVGFPIAITIALFYQNMKSNETLNLMIVEITKLSSNIENIRRDYKDGNL